MAYYWVTEAQKYIQSLGFGSTLRPVNQESQDIRINQLGIDNSFSSDKKDLLRFGKGGVDDAEDAEVVLHEYGHAIQDLQQTPFGFGGSVEAGAIGEGFADYWAVTVSNLISPTPDVPCVADWDLVSYTSTIPHCLRRTDTDLHYPGDLTGEVHHDGQIWSRALWDIRLALGHVKTDTIVLQSHFGQRDPTMPQLAGNTVAVAQQLYGRAAARAVRAAFEAARDPLGRTAGGRLVGSRAGDAGGRNRRRLVPSYHRLCRKKLLESFVNKVNLGVHGRSYYTAALKQESQYALRCNLRRKPRKSWQECPGSF